MLTIDTIRFRCQKCDAEKEIRIPESLLFTEVFDFIARIQNESCSSCEEGMTQEEAEDLILEQQELEDYEGLTFYDEIVVMNEEEYDF